jgi:hypothetical protein
VPSTTLMPNTTSTSTTPIPKTRAGPATSTPVQFIFADLVKKKSSNTTATKTSDTQMRARMLSMPLNPFEYTNPCESDPDLCRKKPNGNSSYICVKSFVTQDYTLCMPTQGVDCKSTNPCLNDGICVEDVVDPSSGESQVSASWRCICGRDFTGRLCETEICSPVFQLLENHTMCVPDSEHFSRGEITSSDVDLIVDFHNAIRRQVTPLATNMQKVNKFCIVFYFQSFKSVFSLTYKIYWDVRLQNLAQKRAQLCSVDNINILTRQQPGYG